MSPRDQIRLDALQAKLAERTGKTGYKANCEAIKAEIARLLGDAGASPDSQESAGALHPVQEALAENYSAANRNVSP